MKKLFSLLTLALLTMSAWAQTTVTFDYTQDTGDWTEAGAFTVAKDGVTLAFSNGTINAAYRVYAGSTLTVTGENITNITFTCTSSNPASNFNALDGFNTSTGVWTGSANSVVFTANKQVRITQVSVTLGGEVVTTVAAPTLPASQNFEESLDVEITNNAEGATLYYSTDNLTWTAYTEALHLTETTTVYAKATKDGTDSEVVSATYTKVEPATGTCIVFNYQDDEAITSQQEYTVSRNGASFTVSSGMINGHYRIYKSQTITFTSTAGNILRIEFDGVSGNPASNFGTVEGMTYGGNDGIWIAPTASTTATFTASVAQVRCTEIRVYVDGELPTDFVAAPTLPASQDFEDSMTVTITNNDADATLYYSYDNENWTAYTEPLVLTATTTVYAKAVKGDNESAVVSATYTKVEPQPDITTLAQVNVLGNNKEFEFKGDAVVTKQRGAYLWLRDESGYGLIYGNINGASDVTFAPGTVLSQGWTAKTKIFNGLMEYVDAANVSASNVTNAQLAAIQTITELDTTMVNAYVQVKNVKSFTASGKNVTATMMDGTTMVMYNQFNESIPTEEDNYTVEGVVSTHNGMQLIILGIEGYVPETFDVNNIAEVYELSENSTFTMYNDVVVTYQNGNRLWIRDTENTSGLIYGDIKDENDQALTFNNGDVLSDGWTAKYTVYNNVPEFTDPVDVAASGDTAEAAPFERTTITNANVNEYVILKGISVLHDASNTKRYYNAADSLVLFNTFNLTLPEIEEGATYDVTGLVTIYYGNPQIYITEMTKVEAPAVVRGDVDGNEKVNMDDLTALISYLVYGTPVSDGAAICDNLDSTVVSMDDLTALISYLVYGNWGE